MSLEMSLSGEVSPAILNEFSKLPDEKKSQVMAVFSGKKKSLGLAYCLWLFSCHYLYFGKIGTFFLYLFTCMGLFVWFVVDGFRMKKLVLEQNDKIMLECIATLR